MSRKRFFLLLAMTFAALIPFGCGMACGTLTAGCAAFDGPATKMSDDYMIRCGDVLCNPTFEECSRTKPLTCRYVGYGAARDAGADR